MIENISFCILRGFLITIEMIRVSVISYNTGYTVIFCDMIVSLNFMGIFGMGDYYDFERKSINCYQT